MAITGTLRVDPAVLLDKSSQFNASAVQVQSLYENMIQKVTSLSGNFTGTVAESYIQKFTALKSSMDTVERMIQEHVRDLTQMAEAYTKGTTTAKAAVDDLPPSNI